MFTKAAERPAEGKCLLRIWVVSIETVS